MRCAAQQGKSPEASGPDAAIGKILIDLSERGKNQVVSAAVLKN
jgi:hypothetical protein